MHFFIFFLLMIAFPIGIKAGLPQDFENNLETVAITEDVSISTSDSLSFELVEKETILTTDKIYPRSITNPYKFRPTELIAPVALIGVGVAGLKWKWWKNLIVDVQHDLHSGIPHHLTFDNYLQFAPAVAGYAMNLFGFKGKHNVADATILYATAYILLAATGLPMKFAIHNTRPNGIDHNSFPSGHTGIAFCGAELLRREYWDVSPWIGIAGYLAAGVTGFMRMYNNAHWLNDVLGGAGLGILCAEAAYWLYPYITKVFFPKRYKANLFLSPALSTRNIGIACAITF